MRTTGRRRRADAERSVAAILEAAARVLGRDAHASMDEIAKAAGTSRQTVYAHFPSREALLGALIERATTRVLTALDEAALDSLSAGDAVVRLLEISWRIFEAEPFLLNLPGPPLSAADERERHGPVIGQLERLIRRGRRTGEFDRRSPLGWMVAATIALGHAAGEEVRAGRMTTRQALTAVQQSVGRLLRDEQHERG